MVIPLPVKYCVIPLLLTEPCIGSDFGHVSSSAYNQITIYVSLQVRSSGRIDRVYRLGGQKIVIRFYLRHTNVPVAIIDILSYRGQVCLVYKLKDMSASVD